jgi:hypothetical protein
MGQEYQVNQGDSLSSIAFAFGFNWQTIWNHPNNAALKSQRKDANVLYPGDVVYIPDKDPRMENCAVDATHKFVRKATPDRLRIRLLRDFQPRANEPYTLVVDGKTINGTTDGDGMVDQPLSPGAQQAKLILDGGKEVHDLAMRQIDPIDTISGMQGRLRNLGLLSGDITGEMDDNTTSALMAFQASRGLPQTGETDAGTLSQLQSKYGC